VCKSDLAGPKQYAGTFLHSNQSLNIFSLISDFISVLLLVIVSILITSLIKLWLRIPLVKTDDDAMDANSTSFVSDFPFHFAFFFQFIRFIIFIPSQNGKYIYIYIFTIVPGLKIFKAQGFGLVEINFNGIPCGLMGLFSLKT